MCADEFEHLGECPNEIELTAVKNLGERGEDPPAVEDSGDVDNGEGLCLQVQAPDPGPILGGHEIDGESEDALVKQPAMEQTGPRVRVVDHRRIVDGKDPDPRVECNVAHSHRRTFESPRRSFDCCMVAAEKVDVEAMCGFEERRKVAWGEPIVTVEEGDVLSDGGGEALVPCIGKSARLGVGDDLEAREVSGVSVEHFGGVIRRTVVDEYELGALPDVALLKETAEHRRQVRRPVLRGNDDAEVSVGHRILPV